MDIQYSENYELNTYLKSTKNVCLCTVISIFLIILFVISPLKNLFITSMIGKIFAVIILGYGLYTNIVNTNIFLNNNNVFEGSWNSIKTNIFCSYIFSLFIFILLVTVFRKLFE